MLQSFKTIQRRDADVEALSGLLVAAAVIVSIALGLFFGWVILALAVGGR